MTQAIVYLILLLEKNREGRSNESAGTHSSPFDPKLAEKAQCDECFLCCDYVPVPVRMCSLRAEERAYVRHFIATRVQARDGVFVPGTSLRPDT